MAWLAGWDHRLKFSVYHPVVDEEQLNYPVPIHLSATAGKDSQDVSFIFDELNSDDLRKAIAVTTSDGTTQCYVEIEKFDSTNKEAILWVKAPRLDPATDTEFYLYYDAAHSNNTDYVGDQGETAAINVWKSEYKAVFHCNQGGSGASLAKDSTGNNDANPGSLSVVSGLIGDEYSDDRTHYLNQDSSCNWEDKKGSFSCFYTHVAGGDGDALGIYGVAGTDHPDFEVLISDTRIRIRKYNEAGTLVLDYEPYYTSGSDRHYFVIQQTGNGIEIYIDNILKGNSSSTHWVNGLGTNARCMVGWIGGYAKFKGTFDEARYTNIPTTVSTRKLDYNIAYDKVISFGASEDDTIPHIDGKVIINRLNSYFDGILSLSPNTDQVDGRCYVIDSCDPNLDGKTRIKSSATDLLDGKLHGIIHTTNLLDGKVHPVYRVANTFDGKVAPTDRLGNLNAYAPLPSTVFKLGGHIVNDVPCVNSSLLGVFRYAKMEASLFPFSFQAFTGSLINENVLGFVSNIIASNPHVGIINGYLEPLYGVFKVGTGIKSKVDLYGCKIYADTANVSKIDGYIPGIISLSSGDSEDIARVLGSIVSPNGSFSGIVGNVGSVYGRIPYLLQVIEAKPGTISSIIGEASSIGATVTASRSGDIIIISDIPSVKWHSSVGVGIKCVILKYVRSV